jgi:hypothetical protein
MTDEKDKELLAIDESIVKYESKMAEIEKEIEAAVKDDKSVDIEAKRIAYEEAEKKYKEAVELAKNSTRQSELADFAAKRGIGDDKSKISAKGGKRVRKMTFRGKEIYFDRAAPRKAVRQMGTALFLCFDEPNHTKITSAFSNRTGTNALVNNNWNDTVHPIDDLDVRSGFAIKNGGNYYYHTDTGYANARNAGPTEKSAMGIERWWKRYTDYFKYMVAVADQTDFDKEIIPDIPSGLLPIRNAGKWIQMHANDKTHVENILFGGKVKNYVPLTIQKPIKDFAWNYHMGVKEDEMLGFFRFLFPAVLNLDQNKLLSQVPGQVDSRLGETKYLDQDYKSMCIYPVYSEQSTSEVKKLTLTDTIDPKTGLPQKGKMDNDFVKSDGSKIYFKKWGSYNMESELTGKGFKGYVAAFNDMFAANQEFEKELIAHCGTTDATKTGSFRALTISNYGSTTGTFLSSDDKIISVPEPDVTDLTQKKIAYEKALGEHNPTDTKMLYAELRIVSKKRDELLEKRRKLTGTTEKGLINSIRPQITHLIKDDDKRSKREISYYEDFKERLEKLTEAVVERVAKHHDWGSDSNDKKNWKVWEAKTVDFPSDEKEFTSTLIGNIAKAYKNAWGKDGHGTKAQPLYGKLNSIFYSKRPKNETYDAYLENFLKNKDNGKKVEDILKTLSELENHVALTIDDKELRDKLKSSDILIKSLEGMLEKILGKGYDRKILERWKKTEYATEPKFYELVTEPEDISAGAEKEFKDFAKDQEAKWLNKSFADFLKEEDNMEQAISMIMLFRIRRYMKRVQTERDEFDSNKVLNWFTVLEKNFGDASGLPTTPEGRNADEVKNYLIKKVGKVVSDHLGLDMKKEVEVALVLKWNAMKDGRKYAEKVGSMKTDEEFLKAKGKDWKSFIKSGEPEEVVAEICRYKIEKTGITAENLAEIKKGDKEKEAKLDELESNLEDLENIGKITEEEKKLKMAVAAHKVKLEGTKETPKPKETPKDETPKETPKKKEGEETTGDKKDQTATTEKKWYEKYGYMAIWLPILLIGAGVAIWYFAFRKPGAEEGGEGNEEGADESKSTE